MSEVTDQVIEKPAAVPFVWGTGRRKSSVARIRIRPGTGVIQVNGKDIKDYFPTAAQIRTILTPLKATNTLNRYDIYCNASGGGFSGQAGAMLLGIARALAKSDASLEAKLRSEHLMHRDPREKERKKPGKKGARASFQFSKR